MADAPLRITLIMFLRWSLAVRRGGVQASRQGGAAGAELRGVESSESEPDVSTQRCSSTASMTATVDGTMVATTSAGASSRARARHRYGPVEIPSLTNRAASGGSAGRVRTPVPAGESTRSTRKLRHFFLSISRATRYQRRPVDTSRYGSAWRRVSVPRPVAVDETQPLARLACLGEERGTVIRNRGRSHGKRHRRCRESLNPVAEPGREHLVDRCGSAGGGFLHAARCDGAQADGDRDGGVVVEQQRRQAIARPQRVATVAARRRGHQVAEVTQPLDVAADGPGGHAERLG